MTKDQCGFQRKLRILRYAEEKGHVVKACLYFDIGRSSFYRWRQAYAERGNVIWRCLTFNFLTLEFRWTD